MTDYNDYDDDSYLEDDNDDDDDDDDNCDELNDVKTPPFKVGVTYGKTPAKEDEDDDYEDLFDDKEPGTLQMTGGADDYSSDDDSIYNEKDDTEPSNKIILPVGEDTLDYNSGDDDDEEDDDDNYLQKFNTDLNKNYVVDSHPECLINNFDEIIKFTFVVKDKNNNIIDPLHKTVPFLTKYERTRVIGQRAKQIEYGAKPFISIPDNIIDGNLIAELELQQKKIPFIIRRPIPGGSFEYWSLKDLEIIGF